jgi:ribosome-associated protein
MLSCCRLLFFNNSSLLTTASRPKTDIKFKHLHYLEQLASLTNRKKKSATRLTKNSKIIKTIIAAIQEKKGENIISLDLRKINEAVADFFIICEAGNQPQVRAIAENVEAQVHIACEENPYHHEGYHNLHWVLIDYVNVVVHVMLSEDRKFYKLEEMWSDAAAEEHDE